MGEDNLRSRPVYVEWIDSQTTSGWRAPAAVNDLRCWTMGFFVAESEEWISVAGSVSAEDVCDQITIPRCAITKLEEIRWV